MKFQLKALAAAVVLSASSLSAQAAIELGSTGNGSFVLSVWNAELGSATFDLGYHYDSFAGLVSQGTFDLSSGNYADAWSFISAASSAPTSWAIYAADKFGSKSVNGSLGYFTTANSLTGMNQLATSYATFSGNLTKMDDYLKNNNNLTVGSNHNAVDDGASTSALTSSSGAGSSNAYGTGKVGGFGPVAKAQLDESLQMLLILNQGNGATASFMTNAAGENYTFTLSSAGLLSVGPVTTPVPEADSYAMLLAGLGVLGLVTRRRKA